MHTFVFSSDFAVISILVSDIDVGPGLLLVDQELGGRLEELGALAEDLAVLVLQGALVHDQLVNSLV